MVNYKRWEGSLKLAQKFAKVNRETEGKTCEFPSPFFNPLKRRNIMKKLLILALACNALSLEAIWQGATPEESAEFSRQMAEASAKMAETDKELGQSQLPKAQPTKEERRAQRQEQQKAQEAKFKATIKEYEPIAQEFKKALQSTQTEAAAEQFKQQIIAGIKKIAATIEGQLNLTPEQTAKLQEPLQTAYDLAIRVGEVENSVQDEKINELQTKLSTQLEPLIRAIDSVFEVQKTLMASAMQGKPAIEQEKIKAGAAIVANLIQEIINNLKTKAVTKEKTAETK